MPLDDNLAERVLLRPGRRAVPVVRLRQRDRRTLLGRWHARTQERDDGSRMSDRIECRYHGRDFPEGEIAWLRKLIAGPPAANRHGLSKEFCRRIGWLKPDGGLKDMMARVTMLAMHDDGLIVLPPPKWKQNRPGPIVFGQDTEPPLFPPPTTLDEVRPLKIRTVVGGTRQGKLWNEFVARHHYLGYKTLVGAQMRYAVHDRNGWPLAMIGFSTAAWALAPRDRFIGWTPTLRRKNLPLVIDDPRFLIPPLDPHPQPRIPRPRTRRWRCLQSQAVLSLLQPRLPRRRTDSTAWPNAYVRGPPLRHDGFLLRFAYLK